MYTQHTVYRLVGWLSSTILARWSKSWWKSSTRLRMKCWKRFDKIKATWRRTSPSLWMTSGMRWVSWRKGLLSSLLSELDHPRTSTGKKEMSINFTSIVVLRMLLPQWKWSCWRLSLSILLQWKQWRKPMDESSKALATQQKYIKIANRSDLSWALYGRSTSRCPWEQKRDC